MDRKDLIAFGDEHNDTEMLAFAGTGYAMKNASPTLLPYADEQLPLTNDQRRSRSSIIETIFIIRLRVG